MKRKEFAIKFQGRKAIFLSTLTLMFCFLFLASYPVNAQPELTISPDRLAVFVEPHGMVTETLTISSTGHITVTWEMNEHSCDNPVYIPWVSQDPMTGTMPPGDVNTVVVRFDATGVALTDTKVFTDILCVRYHGEIDVDIPISMTIRQQPLNQTPVPTLRDWGMILMVVLLGISAVLFIRKRRAV